MKKNRCSIVPLQVFRESKNAVWALLRPPWRRSRRHLTPLVGCPQSHPTRRLPPSQKKIMWAPMLCRASPENSMAAPLCSRENVLSAPMTAAGWYQPSDSGASPATLLHSKHTSSVASGCSSSADCRWRRRRQQRCTAAVKQHRRVASSSSSRLSLPHSRSLVWYVTVSRS